MDTVVVGGIVVAIIVVIIILLWWFSSSYTTLTGWDFSGNDINNTYLESSGECARKCQDTDGCVGAAWSESQKRCWTKHALKGGKIHDDRDTHVMDGYELPADDNVDYYSSLV